MTPPIAYHFWSPTCAPCKVIKPAIEDLKEEFPVVQWVSVNTHDDTHAYSSKFSVSIVPTIVVMFKDTEVGRHSGTSMISYYSLLRKAISLSKATTS
jgi:thiol-disulfide isomerase/thioredoxin